MARRIALLGGSFDPVHLGHEALAQAALAQLPIDELWWLPAGQPWQKRRALAPAAHRVAMLELVRHGDARQRIETCEIDRGGPTYTIDTLEALHADHPGWRWTLVIGLDQLRGLPTWHRWLEVLQLADLAVAVRPEDRRVPEGATADELVTQALQAWPVSAATSAPRVLQMPALAVSSTGIRAQLATGADVNDQVPREVARYIATHGLYRAPG